MVAKRRPYEEWFAAMEELGHCFAGGTKCIRCGLETDIDDPMFIEHQPRRGCQGTGTVENPHP